MFASYFQQIVRVIRDMQDALKRHRYSDLTAELAALGIDEDGCLNAAEPAELQTYLERYSAVQHRWWDLALQRRESRSEFQRYIGKRAVLDGFWGRIKKEVQQLCLTAEVRVAYGSAGPNMASTGRGQLSVPTTGTYKACRRAFSTELEDEFRTSVVCWETGRQNEGGIRDARGGAHEISCRLSGQVQI